MTNHVKLLCTKTVNMYPLGNDMDGLKATGALRMFHVMWHAIKGHRLHTLNHLAISTTSAIRNLR